MKVEILIIGAGKSATVLIEYLQKQAVENSWYIVLADGDLKLAETKWNHSPNGHAVGIDVNDAEQRKALIQKATVVVSMLPPMLHFLVAKDCLEFSKSLFTASYVDENMRSMAASIEAKKILCLCEMGLDPGIDHMSAMELIHKIQAKGGQITGFKSHCGGLIAPESDNNPWHYKISWNANNIVLAGKAGAEFIQNGMQQTIPYLHLFENAPNLSVPNMGAFGYYPNRNSFTYIDTYALQGINNFVRTTLRHPHFFMGWNAIVQLGLTDEQPINLKENECIRDWLEGHLGANNLNSLYASFLKNEIIKKQFTYLDFTSEAIIPHHLKSNAAILQWILENKWKLAPTDKDMVVMMHEIEYLLNHQKYLVQSSMVKKGINASHTAMATTVGLPLAMSVCAYLKGEFNLTGLHIPTHPSIYTPILKTLAAEGIVFEETTIKIN
jgi:saccharopine dehydrogenase-like NADP-dependent oxidoreductase